MHGDLGRVRRGDVVLLLSYTGNTEEVVTLAELLKQDGIPLDCSDRPGRRGPGPYCRRPADGGRCDRGLPPGPRPHQQQHRHAGLGRRVGAVGQPGPLVSPPTTFRSFTPAAGWVAN